MVQWFIMIDHFLCSFSGALFPPGGLGPLYIVNVGVLLRSFASGWLVEEPTPIGNSIGVEKC